MEVLFIARADLISWHYWRHSRTGEHDTRTQSAPVILARIKKDVRIQRPRGRAYKWNTYSCMNFRSLWFFFFFSNRVFFFSPTLRTAVRSYVLITCKKVKEHDPAYCLCLAVRFRLQIKCIVQHLLCSLHKTRWVCLPLLDAEAIEVRRQSSDRAEGWRQSRETITEQGNDDRTGWRW